MPNLLQKKLREHQKAVVVCAVLTAIATFRFINTHHATSVTVEARALKKTTTDLVLALRNNDEALIRRLTTADGFSALQRAKMQGNVGSYTILSNRITQEWLTTPNTCSYLRNVGSNSDELGGCSYETNLQQDHFAMTHMLSGAANGTISFKHTSKGWVLDSYKSSNWFYNAPDLKMAADSMKQALGNVAALTVPTH